MKKGFYTVLLVSVFACMNVSNAKESVHSLAVAYNSTETQWNHYSGTNGIERTNGTSLDYSFRFHENVYVNFGGNSFETSSFDYSLVSENLEDFDVDVSARNIGIGFDYEINSKLSTFFEASIIDWELDIENRSVGDRENFTGSDPKFKVGFAYEIVENLALVLFWEDASLKYRDNLRQTTVDSAGTVITTDKTLHYIYEIQNTSLGVRYTF